MKKKYNIINWALGIGTLVMTVINAPMIRFFGKWIEKAETNGR